MIKPNMFTKSFKLKSSEICDDLLIYIRMKLIKCKKELIDVMLTLPSDLYFECQVLMKIEMILKVILQKFGPYNVEEEIEFLEREELD